MRRREPRRLVASIDPRQWPDLCSPVAARSRLSAEESAAFTHAAGFMFKRIDK
jgi:hypothetical protein